MRTKLLHVCVVALALVAVARADEEPAEAVEDDEPGSCDFETSEEFLALQKEVSRLTAANEALEAEAAALKVADAPEDTLEGAAADFLASGKRLAALGYATASEKAAPYTEKVAPAVEHLKETAAELAGTTTAHLSKLMEDAEPRLAAAKEAAAPYVNAAYERAEAAAAAAHEAVSPHLDAAATAAQPHLDKAKALAKEALESEHGRRAAAAASAVADRLALLTQDARLKALEALKSYPPLAPYATPELAALLVSLSIAVATLVALSLGHRMIFGGKKKVPKDVSKRSVELRSPGGSSPTTPPAGAATPGSNKSTGGRPTVVNSGGQKLRFG